MNPSVRAEIITRRTYNRPLDEEGKLFETWGQTVDRSISHQRWLWERAQSSSLSFGQLDELEELRELMLARKVSMAGRTLWLGGTPLSRSREASMFNCAFLRVQTVYDIVDSMWLLLNGCGVGFSPVIGTLNGFSAVIPKISFVRSTKGPDARGREENTESFQNGIWTITVGDSAEAWAKALGKVVAGKHRAAELVFDTSEIRGAGARLNGYGWISAGDGPLVKAIESICGVMNRRAGCLLSRIDILDIMNWMGTILSTRRSAEIALFCVDEPEWKEFANAKRHMYEDGNTQREQSNNSLVFNHRPSYAQLSEIFHSMVEGGGSEPGLINAEAARKRAPWWFGMNPCAEILLGDKSFCNLTEIDIGKFKGDAAGLERALSLVARANYRQTCVNLEDGILQEAWHLNNQFLRLCGVGLTGIVKRLELTEYDLTYMQRCATSAAMNMADELNMPRPKNVTTVKPSGTLSKIMDTTEGIHKPLGRYILNNVGFGEHDPLVPVLRAAGYRVRPKPGDDSSVLVTLPACYEDVEFDIVDGVEVNLESAIDQLERYKFYQRNWTQQNTSVTISYSPDEINKIIDWVYHNWDDYVGVSFLFRNDPTKTAADLGYQYLPQEVVDKGTYYAYVEQLSDININDYNSLDELQEEECALGVCPTK